MFIYNIWKESVEIMKKFGMLNILLSMILLGSCSLDGANENNQSSKISTAESTNTQSSESDTSAESEDSLSPYSDEEIEYARVWLNFGSNRDVEKLEVILLPKGSLINPNNVNYGGYPEDVIQIRGPQEADGHIVYSVSEEGSGYIQIYPIPYNFETDQSPDIAQYENIADHTESAYVEPGNNESVSQLIDKLTISEKDSYISKDAAIDLYEACIKATSNGEASGLNSEFYSRDYFAVARDEPDYLMLSFENQGRGGQDFYVFKGEGNTITIDTYFESYEKEEPDIQWTYDIQTEAFTEKLSQERENQQKVIDPFTEETVFEYIKDQEGFSDDIEVEVSETRDDGSMELTLASKELKRNGGSGTVDTFIIYPNGNYHSKHD